MLTHKNFPTHFVTYLRIEGHETYVVGKHLLVLTFSCILVYVLSIEHFFSFYFIILYIYIYMRMCVFYFM